MRFGKRLTAVTQNSNANEPYLSYKELKQMVSKVAMIYSGKEDNDNSSADEGHSGPPQHQQASSSSSAAPASSHASRRLAAPQQEFFHRIDADVSFVKLYVQNAVAGLEAIIGEWQVSAIQAGLLFTPEQLQEVASELPFALPSTEALVAWLLSLQPGSSGKEARRALAEKYSTIAVMLNNLLQYIEVNLTAIRKIFKKFEKKVPAEIRVRNARDYKAHHDFFMPSMQHMFVTAVQIQRLVLVAEATDGSEGAKGALLTQIGPESLALLTWLCGPAAVDEVLGTLPAARIDVYAKPGGLPADTAHATPGGATTQASAGGQVGVAVPVRQAFQAAAVGQAQANQAQMQSQGQALQAENESPRDESPEDAGGEDLVSKTGRRRGGRNNRSGGRGRKAAEQQGGQQPQQSPALSPACTEIGLSPPAVSSAGVVQPGLVGADAAASLAVQQPQKQAQQKPSQHSQQSKQFQQSQQSQSPQKSQTHSQQSQQSLHSADTKLSQQHHNQHNQQQQQQQHEPHQRQQQQQQQQQPQQQQEQQQQQSQQQQQHVQAQFLQQQLLQQHHLQQQLQQHLQQQLQQQFQQQQSPQQLGNFASSPISFGNSSGKGGVSPAGAGRSGGKGGRASATVSKGAEQGFGIFGQMPAMVGAMQGTDPNLLAAMMPMFWPAPIAPRAG
ncbi:unnamed protein product [Polarella glacialis]|uniref:SPX domain-containing protein n=1 Tax=Polarella glacialis TaxID=89957 RepID=A0A813HIQ3_POLGL|nr:unnamed protein product [Polarella glacialis]